MSDKVLIVDDEPAMRRLLTRALTPCRTIEAADGRDALRLATDELPDLIVLDLGMPVLDGWQVLARLRSDPRTQATPVILLTGAAGTPEKVQGLERGADDYVTKPFVIEELRARVLQLMRRRRVASLAQTLTGLPGGAAIELEVTDRLRRRSPFALLCLDIDGFKAYNDAYGHSAGDRVIRETGQLLTRSLEPAEDPSFAGHVGGDDFVAVTALDDAAGAALRLVQGFDARVASFYEPEHRREHGLRAPDGSFHPLLTVSVGVATTQRRVFRAYAEMTAVACEMKAYLKNRRERSSRFAFDRRAG